MADLSFLTDADVDILQGLIDRERNQRLGTTSYHEAPDRLDIDAESNTYIVEVPSDGLPP